MEEKDLELSITERGKKGKIKVIASCTYLEEKFQECTKRGRVGLATSVETEGVDLKTTTKQLGAKVTVGRTKCDVRFSIARKNCVFQNNYV